MEPPLWRRGREPRPLYLSWHRPTKLGGKTKNLGQFDDEEEAARAFDAEARKHNRKLNFPATDAERAAKEQHAASHSRLTGVSKYHGGWAVKIYHGGRAPRIAPCACTCSAARDSSTAESVRPSSSRCWPSLSSSRTTDGMAC